MVIKNSFVTKDQNIKQKSKRNRNSLVVATWNFLPESQSGFRKGRGCADMIFVARQLVEKARERGESLYVLFVDLRKAYDSVPRQALWKVLEKYGVPEKNVDCCEVFP